MQKYLDIFIESYSGYWNYLLQEITSFHWLNHFFGLIFVSVLVWVLKYFFNNPKIHIWHHAKVLPKHIKNDVNCGLTLSIWDYLFKTSHVPHDGRDIELSFLGDEHFPKKFIELEIYPLKTK